MKATYTYKVRVDHELFLSFRGRLKITKKIRKFNHILFLEAFTAFDTDGDGKIVPSELGILMRSLSENPIQAQLKTIIAEEKLNSSSDFTRTGYVVVSDLKHILTSIGEKLEPAEFDEWIREVDVGFHGKSKYEGLHCSYGC